MRKKIKELALAAGEYAANEQLKGLPAILLKPIKRLVVACALSAVEAFYEEEVRPRLAALRAGVKA